MPTIPPSELNASTVAGIFKASAKREHSDQTIQRRRLELLEMNRRILSERDLKLAAQPGLTLNAIYPDQRGSSTLAVTSLIGGVSFAMIAVVATIGSRISFPGTGIAISASVGAAVAGAAVGMVFGAACSVLISRWMKRPEVAEAAASVGDGSRQARVFRSLSSQSFGQRPRFEQEWTRSNLG